MQPDTAVIFCAGLGERMRPLSLSTPKPLLPLAGQPILAHTMARLRDAGVEKVIANAFHLADQVESFFAQYDNVTVLREDRLLDTGGALAAMEAQGVLPDVPFYILNGDSYWVDGPSAALPRLAAAFDTAREDATLLLARSAGTIAETRYGDFMWSREGELRRRLEREVAPYLYSGIQIATKTLLHGAAVESFSMNRLWDEALAEGRLNAIIHDGVWLHMTTPADIERAEELLAAREVGNST
ncbi:nucleotidyltransferase family protein [Acidocella aminolytica]|jgi:MurNAc alpha-1-phosphate uridylyltransferase|uniref:Mannose-1-phosphate guanylyltransferase n=1 Tax=Acidocella aminolytica 101 = DSM 11237 TaxID=1120923 RepID=A0A0D6PJA3_9PROT|nr:nucleotidyltransferase family protein [Acidocella aminolytica]GAN81752.1 mannose-1-phosphate guanylyltransferase [Acidocella aminolytica 101 = DSM 11237]GBQ39011.1 nucleoside-diphosphate-sugar pyrophosphorylase [Acidocella aminolytica 101 = DSM 11237]SHF47228.1 MobA-like NTP transferase domain-containing protein [Acidocella aminolytica 101 = DSM 11237]